MMESEPDGKRHAVQTYTKANVKLNAYNMRYLVIIINMLVLSTQLYAQSIKGQVIDRNGSAIEFANIVLMKDSLFVTGVITNTEGIFEMTHSFNKDHCVVVSAMGYKSCMMEIPSTGDFGAIMLDEAEIMLDELVVSASRPITQLKGGALVTTIENSALSKMGTAADVLARLPLVKETDGSYTVFGKGTPQIYINGRLVRNTNELERLSSEHIRSVEVITSPGSQYAATVQSVIRIKTIPYRGEGFSADLYNATRVSHFARNASDFSFNYRHDKLDIFADSYFSFGKKNYFDQAKMITDDANILHQSIETRSVQKFNDLSGKIGVNYQISEDQFIGCYYSLGREYSRTHAVPVSQVDLFDGNSLVSSEMVVSDWMSRSISSPVHKLNFYYNGSMGKFDIDFNADFTKKHSESDDTHDEISQTDPDVNRHIISEGDKKSRLLAEKLIVSHPLGKGKIEMGEEYTNSRLSYGYDYDGAFSDDSFSEIREDNFAAFAMIMQRLGIFNLSAGLRFEHVIYKYLEDGNSSSSLSKEYDNIFPTFSMDAILGQAKLSLSFTTRTLRPSYQQLDGGIRYINNFTYQCGNPKLQPTKKYTVQIAGMWKWLFAQASVNHDVNSIFWTTTQYMDDSSVKLLSFENIPRYTQIQFVMGAQPTFGCWKPQATAGVIKQFYTSTCSGKIQRFDKPQYSFTLNNTISLPKGWALGADFQFTTTGNMQNMSLSSTNKVDLMVRKSFLDGNLILAIYANDLFDKSMGRTAIYSKDIFTEIYNKSEQRSIRFTIRYKLNTVRSKYRGTGAGEIEKSRM